MEGLYLFYLPFEGISNFLRALSLSGAVGNAAAFFLYILISLIPVIYLLFRLKRKKLAMKGADIWLLVLSGYTFYLLYVFINPALLAGRLPKQMAREAALPLLKAVYAGLWLSIFSAWVLLTLIQRLNSAKILDCKEFLYRGLSFLLKAAMAVYGLAALYGAGTECYLRFSQIRANAAGTELDLFFAAARFFVTIVPAGFLLGILYSAGKLLAVMKEKQYGPQEVEAARRLAAVSGNTVAASVFVSLAWNGALFFCAGRLTSVHYSWELSLFPLTMAFAALILARYQREAGELYQDNEMII